MLLSDLMVHLGLGKLWFIHLVMSIFPVANEIKQDVLAELPLVLYGKSDCPMHVLNMFCVDMKNGDFIGFEEVSGVFRGSGIDGFGSVAYLIVSNQMNGAVYVEIGCFGET